MTAVAAVGLEPAAVSEWILGLGLGAEPPLRFVRAGNGKSNLTYIVTDAAGGRWILRRPPVGPRLASAHDVAREYGVLRALGRTAVPAPAALGFSDDPALGDAPVLLMAFVDGVVLDGPAPGVDAFALTEALVCALARVHAVDLPATGLDGLASHAPYAARQLTRWRRQWSASRTRELPAVERLADRLEAAAPAQRELTLVHGDYHLLNVIAAPGGEEIRAIVDWELCTLGDPLADLGGLLAYWEQDGVVLPAPRLPDLPSPTAVAELYAAATGRDLAALAFWHALALWKVAIICEGVRRRALDDERNAARTGIPPARAVDELIARAEALL